jgi:hypothetical protein
VVVGERRGVGQGLCMASVPAFYFIRAQEVTEILRPCNSIV